jgi:phthalate 4,5-cis-dihydrodiol dehydrogenase
MSSSDAEPEVMQLRVPKLRLGVIGLGRAFMLMLPTFELDSRVQLVAATDPRPEARDRFVKDFAGRACMSVEELCADADVQAVYIASPHQFHVDHVAAAARHGKHILVEKPMAITLEDCQAMIVAARDAGVHLLVGHSHSYDAPYLRARRIIESGKCGRVRMITALNFTDFLYRPRRPEELATAHGGGVAFSQAAHQVDVVRILGGGLVRSVRAATGAWDRTRPTEGAYSALLTFEDGAFATMTYSGYGHFDSDELCGWVDEMGAPRDPERYGTAREILRRAESVEAEAELKNSRAYGVADTASPSGGGDRWHNHFGFVVASCEQADLRPLPQGVMIYGNDERWLDRLPMPAVPRSEVIDELRDAVLLGRTPLHTAEWGMATLEVCLAILRSAEEGRDITLAHQIKAAGARPSARGAPARRRR